MTLQLAWEILELARICYSSKLDELEKSSELPNPSNAAARRVVEDAAFVHLRLGDLLTVEEQFVEATEVGKIHMSDLKSAAYCPFTACSGFLCCQEY